MSLQFAQISSPGGVRDYIINFEKVLKPTEILTGTPTVNTDATKITITNIAINTSLDQGVPANKGVKFTVTTVPTITVAEDVTIDVSYTGDGGSSDTYRTVQPMVPKLER